ncbi:hypothetical protein BCEN4_820051 [Burkholderia cenocepacia]|nr:hypothetical protein BCEN4_820051 [Burkholderia cenocepacia]
MFQADGWGRVDSYRLIHRPTDPPIHHRHRLTTKKKAPEGAFNMLRLVRQAD